MVRVLCLCTGNSCRSPMLEAHVRHWVEEGEGLLKGVEVRVGSAGCATRTGAHSVAHGSVLAMERRGLDISDHCNTHLADVPSLEVSPPSLLVSSC